MQIMEHAKDCTCTKCKEKNESATKELIKVTTVIVEEETIPVPLIEPSSLVVEEIPIVRRPLLKRICIVGSAICDRAVYLVIGMIMGVVLMGFLYNFR